MTDLDLEIPGLANELIEEFGKAVVFTGVTIPAYNPDTGMTTAGVGGSSLSVKAIVEPDKGQALRMGLTEGADLKLTVAAQSLPNGVTSEDKFTIDTLIYNVVNVKPIYSGELIAIYEILVRR